MSIENTIVDLTTAVKAQNETMHELTLAIRELITAFGSVKVDSEPAKRRKSAKTETVAVVEEPKVETPVAEAAPVETPVAEAAPVESTPVETPKVGAASDAQNTTDASTKATAEVSDAQQSKEKASEYAQGLKNEAITKAKELVANTPGHIHHLKALLVKYGVGKMSDLPLEVVPDFHIEFNNLVKALENDIL